MTNQLTLTPEVCDNILKMIQSSDKDNLTVAVETLRYIDVHENLPYLLIMYKESSKELRSALFMETIFDKMKNNCHHIPFDDSSIVTYNMIYTELKAHTVPKEALEYFLEKFAASIKKNMVEWGFSFLNDFNLKLISIKNESSGFTS